MARRPIERAFILAIVITIVGCMSDGRPDGDRTALRDGALRPQAGVESVAPTNAATSFQLLVSDGVGTDAIPGYRHTSLHSKFSRGLGSPSLDNSIIGIRRETSVNGVFVEYANGYAAGIPNGNAQSYAVGAYSSDSAVHSARVLRYFEDVGLPSAQVGGTRINTWMREGGRTANVPAAGQPSTAPSIETRKLVGYVTIVERMVSGVPVDDSFAWAMFGKDDLVVYEQVWWPELRGSIVHEAMDFGDKLSQPGFREGLLAGDGEGRLAIHHATPTGERWYSQVTFDVWRNGDAAIHHFDKTGREVQLSAWTPATSDPK